MTVNHYFGDTHSHTSYSDGTGTPADAFYARDTAHIDFLAITDHSNSLNVQNGQIFLLKQMLLLKMAFLLA